MDRKLPLSLYRTHPRILLVSAALLCALLAIGIYWFSLSSSSSQPKPAEVPPSIPSTSLTTQSNPLFATQPTWVQDFRAATTSLDTDTWTALVGVIDNSNKEQQYYTDSKSNLRIENGALRLIATYNAASKAYPYQSARLETQGKKSFLYGRLDITAKLPAGVGTWPAIWMLPATTKYADLSPASNTLRYKNGGEIDVMEAVGFQPTVVYGVAHALSDTTQRSDGTGSHNSVVVADNTSKFHTYTLLWTPTSLTYQVDNTTYFTYTKADNADYKTWPFDQPFYMIINLAMGGTWGGMDTEHFPENGIDNSALPASLDIQSIYYYPYAGK